ncbi:unnamed protein product [Protopolystoma xenopodis]|uniref:Uncharacterized protein n=1 Tax=Protopolystoma xenopodis TaxID=117903 RepID=A0A3S5FGG0_9PLAT|nr:unnamed protein product [Protopolystoma xenopodis]
MGVYWRLVEVHFPGGREAEDLVCQLGPHLAELSEAEILFLGPVDASGSLKHTSLLFALPSLLFSSEAAGNGSGENTDFSMSWLVGWLTDRLRPKEAGSIESTRLEAKGRLCPTDRELESSGQTNTSGCPGGSEERCVEQIILLDELGCELLPRPLTDGPPNKPSLRQEGPHSQKSSNASSSNLLPSPSSRLKIPRRSSFQRPRRPGLLLWPTSQLDTQTSCFRAYRFAWPRIVWRAVCVPASVSFGWVHVH